MSIAAVLTPTWIAPRAGNRAKNAVRKVAAVAHDAGRLKTLAADAVEDGLHAARRAVTRGLHEFEDVRDAAAHRVKRAPLTTMAAAVGVGILVGMAFGWFRPRSARTHKG